MTTSWKLRVIAGLSVVIVCVGVRSYGSCMSWDPPRGGGGGEPASALDAAAVGGDRSPQGCPGIPPCEELLRFKARCRLRVIGLLIVKVKLVPPDPGPGPQKNVLIGVNGQPFCVPFNGRLAKLVLENRVGQQFCEVLDPPNCFRPIIVDCGL